MNGLLVEHDASAMAIAIQRLLDEPSYARVLGENGCRAVAERWTLEHSVDRLEKRLMEALRAAGTPKSLSRVAESSVA
jgi:hypothetical protein